MHVSLKGGVKTQSLRNDLYCCVSRTRNIMAQDGIIGFDVTAWDSWRHVWVPCMDV